MNAADELRADQPDANGFTHRPGKVPNFGGNGNGSRCSRSRIRRADETLGAAARSRTASQRKRWRPDGRLPGLASGSSLPSTSPPELNSIQGRVGSSARPPGPFAQAWHDPKL